MPLAPMYSIAKILKIGKRIFSRLAMRKGQIGMNQHISRLAEEIAGACSPEKIYIFHIKVDLSHQVTGFKACVIADAEDKQALERQIYREVDCELPYDLVLYTPSEWDSFSHTPSSFASEIAEKGVLVYGEEKA